MKTGRHEGKTVFKLTVSVCESSNGGVASTHDFATPQDAEVASNLDSGGARQIAYALLVEALLREVFCDVLLKLQDDPDFLKKYREANEADRTITKDVLGEQARQIMQQNLLRMGSEAAESVLEMLCAQGETSG